MPYTVTQARTGLGTAVYYSATENGSYTKLADEGLDFTGPSLSLEKIEVTNMDSSGKEYIPALQGSESANQNYNYTDVSLSAIVALFGVQQWWEFRYSNGGKWKSPGFIEKVGNTTPVQGVMLVEVAWCLSAPTTYIPA